MKVYYIGAFILTIIFSSIYAVIYRKRFNPYISLIILLIPITTLGYMIQYLATQTNEAIFGIKLTYIGGCYLNLFMVYTIFDLADLNLKKSIKLLLFFLTLFSLLSAMTIGYKPWFYKSITGQLVDGRIVLTKQYSFIHTFYYIQILVYLLISLCAIFYAIKYKPGVSNKILKLLFLCEFTSIAAFFAGKIHNSNVDLLTLSYVINELIVIRITRRIAISDVTGTVIDSIALNGKTGFVSFDDAFNYLASNTMARTIYPELNELKVDKSAARNPVIKAEILSNIERYIINEEKNIYFKKFEDKIYQVEINRMFDGKHRTGYILYISDDTKDQNDILSLHDNLIMSMAMMVESRDNSTGGHIKRTSKVVEILVSEIQNDQTPDALKLNSVFCEKIIKAAPMHDLGKIAVDDAILRKPGRFTPEEFEIMKTHAAKGAEIVCTILSGTNDAVFHNIAENVAHYHHERWDGSGYPEHLKGEQIPIEARIMAIADVYDALVSKRVYKDAMSFAKADSIMMESFGTHFDKRFEKYYVAARPRLEEYYKQEEQAAPATSAS